MSNSIYQYIEPITTGDGTVIGYKVIKDKTYFSKRYNESISISTTDKPYDGATGAFDIDSFGWVFHDVVKRDKCFDSGNPCSNYQASMILSDILSSENRWVRSKTWFISTLIWGTFVK
jgi:hypothetical protein